MQRRRTATQLLRSEVLPAEPNNTSVCPFDEAKTSEDHVVPRLESRDIFASDCVEGDVSRGSPLRSRDALPRFPLLLPRLCLAGAGPTPGVVKIEIMDSGIGIAKQAAARLFQRFQQADSTISQGYGGVGLGLWISRAIIRRMGGDIAIKSRPGLGTNMIVVFPSETCPEASAQSAARPELAGKKCLVVDASTENAYVIQQFLQNNGMQVITRIRAGDALEVCKTVHDLNLIIMDLRMSEMSGQTLISEIRRVETKDERLHVPIMVLAGSTAERAACLGADECLLKPARLQDLAGAAERLLLKAATIGAQRRVLVIDAEPLGRKLITTLIRQSGDVAAGCGTIAEVLKQELTEFA